MLCKRPTTWIYMKRRACLTCLWSLGRSLENIYLAVSNMGRNLWSIFAVKFAIYLYDYLEMYIRQRLCPIAPLLRNRAAQAPFTDPECSQHNKQQQQTTTDALLSTFHCALGWWWMGCYGAVCAHGGHLERGRGE